MPDDGVCVVLKIILISDIFFLQNCNDVINRVMRILLMRSTHSSNLLLNLAKSKNNDTQCANFAVDAQSYARFAPRVEWYLSCRANHHRKWFEWKFKRKTESETPFNLRIRFSTRENGELRQIARMRISHVSSVFIFCYFIRWVINSNAANGWLEWVTMWENIQKIMWENPLTLWVVANVWYHNKNRCQNQKWPIDIWSWLKAALQPTQNKRRSYIFVSTLGEVGQLTSPKDFGTRAKFIGFWNVESLFRQFRRTIN